MASGPKWNKRRGTWYVQYWEGKWKRKTVTDPPPNWKPGMILPAPKKAPPEAIAKRAHFDAVEKAARERVVTGMPTSLEDFLNDHVENYHCENSKRSVRTTVNQFLAWCKAEGIERVDQVTPAVCGEWLKGLARKRKIATTTRVKAQLSKAWKVLGETTSVENPWARVKARGHPGKNDKSSWSKEEFAKLVEHSGPWLRDVLIMGVNTGLRINALTHAEWTDWVRPGADDKHFGRIKVRPELDKVKIGYEVPVSAELHDLLARRFAMASPSKYILTGEKGAPIHGRATTFKSIVAACARAGLKTPISPNHHMRRTFGRWAHFGYLTGKPVPLYVVSRWLGHTSTKTTLVYLDIKEDDSTRFMVPGED